jgi:hypothetical protein
MPCRIKGNKSVPEFLRANGFFVHVYKCKIPINLAVRDEQ